MKKEITGKTLGGEKRVYTFEIMDTETGLGLFYKYSGKIIENENVRKMLNEGIEGTALDIMRLFPAVLSWDDIGYICKKTMAGATTKLDDGDTLEHDENGMAEYMTGDPMELFTALFYALLANYPKYISPLLDAASLDSNQE